MPKMNIGGTSMRSLNLQVDKAGLIVRMNFTSDVSANVQQFFDLDVKNFPDAADGIKLEGEVHGTSLTLTPNGELAEKNFIEVQTVRWVHDFEVKKLWNKERSSSRYELSFQVIATTLKAALELARYFDKVGHEKAKMVISYSEQTTMDTTPAVAEDTQKELQGLENATRQ